MTDDNALRDRVDELEIHIAHLDSMIEDLHTALTAQAAEIAELTRRIAGFGSRLQAVEDSAGAPPPEPPPPHY